MPELLHPNSLKIGYVVLINTRKFAIEKLQRKAGYGNSSKWTHVAGSLGGYTAIEANIPRSRLINLQKEYVNKGYEIKVLKRKGQEQDKRYKVALWWATMNNLPYDVPLNFSLEIFQRYGIIYGVEFQKTEIPTTENRRKDYRRG